MYIFSLCCALIHAFTCYPGDACSIQEHEQILTHEAQELLAHRIQADKERAYVPQYMWWFSPHDIYTSLRVKIPESKDDIPAHAYDVELNAAVADVWMAPWHVQHLCGCSGQEIKERLGCMSTIYITQRDIFHDMHRRKFFLYHRLAYIRQAFNNIADSITRIIANKSAYSDDTRLFSSLCTPSPGILLRPEKTHEWYYKILQEITYRCSLQLEKPIECDMAEANYWETQRRSIPSHIKTLTDYGRAPVAYPEKAMPTKQRIDAYLDTLDAAPVVPTRPPNLSSYHEIHHLRDGAVLPSLVYYYAALRHTHPGWHRTYHM